jgi:hypothetical protein
MQSIEKGGKDGNESRKTIVQIIERLILVANGDYKKENNNENSGV